MKGFNGRMYRIGAILQLAGLQLAESDKNCFALLEKIGKTNKVCLASLIIQYFLMEYILFLGIASYIKEAIPKKSMYSIKKY